MHTPQVTRPSLLARVRRADDDAWREFDGVYGGLIVRYCRRCGLQLADAEDVRQVVMAKLSRAMRSFEYDPARGRFRDYLGRSVRNAVFSFFSGHGRGPAPVPLNEAVPAAAGDEALVRSWNEEWTQHHYRRAMRELRTVVDERSLAIFDALLQGRPQHEIEAAFAASPAAIRKVKQRIRDRLQAIIARQIEDEELPTSP